MLAIENPVRASRSLSSDENEWKQQAAPAMPVILINKQSSYLTFMGAPNFWTPLLQSSVQWKMFDGICVHKGLWKSLCKHAGFHVLPNIVVYTVLSLESQTAITLMKPHEDKIPLVTIFWVLKHSIITQFTVVILIPLALRIDDGGGPDKRADM